MISLDILSVYQSILVYTVRKYSHCLTISKTDTAVWTGNERLYLRVKWKWMKSERDHLLGPFYGGVYKKKVFERNSWLSSSEWVGFPAIIRLQNRPVYITVSHREEGERGPSNILGRRKKGLLTGKSPRKRWYGIWTEKPLSLINCSTKCTRGFDAENWSSQQVWKK